MVFVKVVFAENDGAGGTLPEKEKGMRLDENAPVSSLYGNCAEKFGMLVDFEGYRLFTLGPPGTQDRNKVVAELEDDMQLVDVPEVHPSCRILFIDAEIGRQRLKFQNEEKLREMLREVEAYEWSLGRVYLSCLFYTFSPAGEGANAKPRVLTDGRGHLPSIEIRQLAPSSFSPELKARLFRAQAPVEEVIAKSKGDRFANETQALRDAADLLSFKLNTIGIGGNAGAGLGNFFPANPVVLEMQSSVLIVCAKDVGQIACDSFWMDADMMHLALINRYFPGGKHSQLTDLYFKYGLIPEPLPEPEIVEEVVEEVVEVVEGKGMGKVREEVQVEVDLPAEERARERAQEREKEKAEIAKAEAELRGDFEVKEEIDLGAQERQSSVADKFGLGGSLGGSLGGGAGLEVKAHHPRFGAGISAEVEKVEEEGLGLFNDEPAVKERKANKRIHVREEELHLRDVEKVQAKKVDTVIADVVANTVLEMVDMVELTETMEEEMQWRQYEGAMVQDLDEDHAKFDKNLDKLFQVQKVEVPMSDMDLKDHLDADKLMMADLTAEENTPFTQPIRQLVERFGQTILMIEDIEETIVSLEELEQAVKIVDKVAPAYKLKDPEKLHHSFNAALGPNVHDANADLPPPESVRLQGPKLARNKKSLLPKVTQPIETWPERSYALVEEVKAPVMAVSVRLSDLEASVAVADTAAAEEAILVRLYHYMHDKMGTLKSVWMEFDRDGSGSIDDTELYHALRHLGFELDMGEAKLVVASLERRAAEVEYKLHHDHTGYKEHLRQEAQLMGHSKAGGGYQRHVDGKVDYKELTLVLNETAKRKGLLIAKSRFDAKGKLKKRTPGASILGSSKNASKVKGLRGIQGLNSLYRTHARITGKVDATQMINIADLDVIGPITPVDALEPDEYGLLSADKLLYPVRTEAAEECRGLMASPNRIVAIDADGATVQAVAELLEGLVMDDTQLHKNTLRKLHGDMLTLLVAACSIECLRLFIGAVDKVLAGESEAAHELASLQEFVQDSFAMDVSTLEWHKREVTLAGCAPAMDIFWYSRCRKEFDAEDELASCKNMWKQIYCELRFQYHLRLGVENVNKNELVLWESFIGSLVQTVDLSETGCRDNTVAVCIAYCPNVKYLDLHDTKVTDRAIDELITNLKELIWINIEDTAITGDGVENLVQAFPSLELVG